MKLKVGFLYEVRPGECLLVADPHRTSIHRVFGTNLYGGDLFLVLYGPTITSTVYRNFHKYIILHKGRVMIVEQAMEDQLPYIVGFHTP